MARFGNGKKLMRNKKKQLYTRVKGRGFAKRKPLLPKRGMNQTSYEAGFFDFLEVFWNNNKSMDLCNLTRQVANAWDALLPCPKINKKRVYKDYSEEYRALQQEAEKEKLEQENLRKEEEERDRTQRNEKNKSEVKKGENESQTGSSKSNFGEDNESELGGSRSRSDIGDDSEADSISELESDSQGDSLSGSESEESTRKRDGKRKPRRKGRRYENYDAYLQAKNGNTQSGSDKQGEHKNKESGESKENSSNQDKQNGQSNNDAKDGVFLPMRAETSFDRIVEADLNNQTELLKQLKICKPYSDIPFDPDDPDADDTHNVDSDDSFLTPLKEPRLSRIPRGGETTKLLTPTNILLVKNLATGIKKPELQDIFRTFLNDILLIRVLDGKFNGEAIVEFKTVEVAQHVWSQMNGVEYRRLPLILEFVTKEDLLE